MKVRQAIELARGLKQIDQVNYPDILMLQFLNECEGKLQTEFLHIADVDCQRYTEDDMEMDLIVGPPHDKLYYAYLCAMVDFTNGEYAKYNNSIIVANAFMAEWAAWFNRTHERDGRQYLGVFLSAYGIAVKHGYAGTEEEWLESLRGPEGQQGIQGKPGPQGAPGTVSFEELTEEQLAMLRGPEGQQGVPGTDGQDGVGIQSVEQTTTSAEDDGTNVVTVTKTDGTTSTFYVRNGSRGSTGPAGSDGQDGVSPLVSVSEITGGHRVSIQDADGTRSFDVMDGKDGADGQDGKDGQSGAAGADGITPTIGANGNWYVGQTDTGVAAMGPAGPAGPALAVTNTAAVGQTVKITAVGEDGQPTEWEAVDMASATAVTPELLYSGTAENVTSFHQDIDFKGHRNLVIVVSGAKGDADISMTDGSLYMDGNRFVFAYYSSFLSAKSESEPNGSVAYTIFRIGPDRCRVDFSKFDISNTPFWTYLQASSSTQSSARTCYLKSASSTAYEKIGVDFSASVQAVDVEVYGF